MASHKKKAPIPSFTHQVEERSVFQRNGDVVSSEFGDAESVLFNVRDRRSFLLNSTASRIYGLTDGTRNVTMVCNIIAGLYHGDQGKIREDVKEIYRTFLERGIVCHESA